jgi:hypothetical protein
VTGAALRPEDLESEDQTEPAQIVLYDLPPDAHRVLHLPRETKSTDTAPGAANIPPTDTAEQPEQPATIFWYKPADGNTVLIGQWSPARSRRPPDPNATATISFWTTEDASVAELWRADLCAGRLPSSTRQEP